jgi:hypothetical protein
MRYGSEDPGTGKSYSQLEYEKAIKQNKEILIYLIDEEASSVTPSLIQYDKIEKLNTFKAILKKNTQSIPFQILKIGFKTSKKVYGIAYAKTRVNN